MGTRMDHQILIWELTSTNIIIRTTSFTGPRTQSTTLRKRPTWHLTLQARWCYTKIRLWQHVFHSQCDQVGIHTEGKILERMLSQGRRERCNGSSQIRVRTKFSPTFALKYSPRGKRKTKWDVSCTGIFVLILYAYHGFSHLVFCMQNIFYFSY